MVRARASADRENAGPWRPELTFFLPLLCHSQGQAAAGSSWLVQSRGRASEPVSATLALRSLSLLSAASDRCSRPHAPHARGSFSLRRTRHTITQRDFLPEKFLPQWLDMVVWGHEHECIAEPQESVEGQYFVLQPGSSVATSLSGGESVEKKVVIMEIMGDQYRTVPITLHTVRPFVIADVKLSDDLDPIDANPQQIEEYLTDKINEIITSIKRDPRYSNADRPELPLVRLRVDHTGFPRITNINKFGQRFIGKVANPEELLLFSKQKAVATKSQTHRHKLKAQATNLFSPRPRGSLSLSVSFFLRQRRWQLQGSRRQAAGRIPAR